MNDFQSTTDSVKYNASRLADQAASSINSALDDSQRKANEVIDGVRQTVPSALSKAAETADALAPRGMDRYRDASVKARAHADRATDATVSYIRAQPIKSMLIAGAAGLLLSALLRGRSQRD